MAIDIRKPIPLYRQIAEEIRGTILAGKVQVGSQISSQHELARQYGVSLITVKKALSELVHEGVLFSRAGRGTFVERQPAEFKPLKIQTLGIVLRDLASPFFSLIVQGIEANASRLGFSILVSSASNEQEKEDSQIRHFHSIGVSGLIIASMTHDARASEAVRDLHRWEFPYVMVSYLEDPDIYRVGTDHRAGAAMATRHLLDLGRRSIGYIDGEEGNPVGRQRSRGYGEALARSGLEPDPRFQFRLRQRGEWNDFQSGAEIGDQAWANRTLPEAFFVYNDLAALGLLQALLRHGVRVPEDVAIVGFDDIGQAQFATVPLTTVHQPTFEIGTKAVDVLVRRLAGEAAEAQTILMPSLVVRESCGAVSGTAGPQVESRRVP